MEFIRFLKILLLIFIFFGIVTVSYVYFLSQKYNLEIQVYTEPNWTDIPEEYEWFAVDRNGRGYFYVNKPVLREDVGVWATRGFALPAKGSFNVPDWRGALFNRNDKNDNLNL